MGLHRSWMSMGLTDLLPCRTGRHRPAAQLASALLALREFNSGQMVPMGANGTALILDKLDEVIDAVKGGKPFVVC